MRKVHDGVFAGLQLPAGIHNFDNFHIAVQVFICCLLCYSAVFLNRQKQRLFCQLCILIATSRIQLPLTFGLHLAFRVPIYADLLWRFIPLSSRVAYYIN